MKKCNKGFSFSEMPKSEPKKEKHGINEINKVSKIGNYIY